MNTPLDRPIDTRSFRFEHHYDFTTQEASNNASSVN
jgi:hypothetical protein